MKRKIFLFVMTTTLSLTLGCAVNPITGEKQFMLIPASQDVEIGRQYAPQIEKQLGGRIPQPSLQEYIDNVGQKIVSASHRSQWTYHFVALDDDSVNAFALPGGYIFITRGMLEKLQSEAQLAAILAHETVHVVARHSSAAMSKQIGYNLLLSAVSSEETSKSALMIADLTWQIIGLKYSRNDEMQADLAGLDYMVSAGYNPYGMLQTMKMLQRQNKTGSIEFLSTHPSPENRIQYINRKIQEKYVSLSQLEIGQSKYQEAALNLLEN